MEFLEELGEAFDQEFQDCGINYRIVRYGNTPLSINPYVRHVGIKHQPEWNGGMFNDKEYFDTWEIHVTKSNLQSSVLGPNSLTEDSVTTAFTLDTDQFWYVSEDNGTTYIALRVVQHKSDVLRHLLTLVTEGVGQAI